MNLNRYSYIALVILVILNITTIFYIKKLRLSLAFREETISRILNHSKLMEETLVSYYQFQNYPFHSGSSDSQIFLYIPQILCYSCVESKLFDLKEVLSKRGKDQSLNILIAEDENLARSINSWVRNEDGDMFKVVESNELVNALPEFAKTNDMVLFRTKKDSLYNLHYFKDTSMVDTQLFFVRNK